MSTVADFNDNLFYHMQRERGLEHFAGLSPSRVQELEHTLQANEYLGSFLTTKSSLPQPPHVDYPWEILEEHVQDQTLEIGFFPLTEEGMLQCANIIQSIVVVCLSPIHFVANKLACLRIMLCHFQN